MYKLPLESDNSDVHAIPILSYLRLKGLFIKQLHQKVRRSPIVVFLLYYIIDGVKLAEQVEDESLNVRRLQLFALFIMDL